ncbi:MAG: DUF423 domain-containing protein [Nitrospiraceae bacterium]
MLTQALLIGAIAGGLAVAGGAFGAHGLKAVLTPELLQTFETAVRYQLYHALALVALGILGRSAPTRAFEWAARGFTTGMALFCGSLYVLALSGVRWLGAITPLGGVAFVVGWTCFAYGAYRLAKEDRGATPSGR